MTDSHVVVTGAASGIGRAVAVAFAADGRRLSLADRNRDGLAVVAAEISGSQSTPVFHSDCDVSDERDVKRFITAATDAHGPPAVLVNCAGIARMGTVLETTVATWDQVFAVNVRSVFLMCKSVIPLMASRGSGAIVNIASEAGLVGFTSYAAYASSKAAIVNLTRCLALDHAPQRIRVNAVCPGSIETPLLREFFESASDPAAMRRQDETDHPLGIGTARDIAAAVRYLASDDASYVTGSILAVDGGYTAA